MKKYLWIICLVAILLASCGANLSAFNPFQPTQTPVPPTPTQGITCEELVERWNDSFAPMVLTFFPLVMGIPEGKMPAMSASDIDRVMRIQMGMGTSAPDCDSQILQRTRASLLQSRTTGIGVTIWRVVGRPMRAVWKKVYSKYLILR